ncbi:MAG: hypothetical protein J4F45_13400, partial [Pseudomonadales bacterium]|nr:hypothetical protein [Pseudomonadales bacterium]
MAKSDVSRIAAVAILGSLLGACAGQAPTPAPVVVPEPPAEPLPIPPPPPPPSIEPVRVEPPPPVEPPSAMTQALVEEATRFELAGS